MYWRIYVDLMTNWEFDLTWLDIYLDWNKPLILTETTVTSWLTTIVFCHWRNNFEFPEARVCCVVYLHPVKAFFESSHNPTCSQNPQTDLFVTLKRVHISDISRRTVTRRTTKLRSRMLYCRTIYQPGKEDKIIPSKRWTSIVFNNGFNPFSTGNE